MEIEQQIHVKRPLRAGSVRHFEQTKIQRKGRGYSPWEENSEQGETSNGHLRHKDGSRKKKWRSAELECEAPGRSGASQVQ